MSETKSTDTAEYIDYLHKCKEAEKKQNLLRQKEALKVANSIIVMLKKKYRPKEVYIFGSILTPQFFSQRSDIDIAISGIDNSLYWKALSDSNLLAKDFKLDMVDLADCRASIKKTILERGKKI